MGYGWNTRDGETVQRHNGQAYTFDKIAQRYESIVPLRGKRKALDIDRMVSVIDVGNVSSRSMTTSIT